MGELSHILTFPDALGTGIVITLGQNPPDGFHHSITALIDRYESELSRFRDDSTVAAMSQSAHGGSFDFSDELRHLFDIYDALYSASSGAIDPLIGEDLVKLGYGPDLSFTMQAGAFKNTGAIHGRACWPDAVEREGSTLTTHQAIQLDFGAVGKGFLVDLIAQHIGHAKQYVIDAGGDLLIHTAQPQSIALEDPADSSQAVGLASIADASFCASAPSRRHWYVNAADGQPPTALAKQSQLILMHHLLNAIDGKPVRNVAATWVAVKTDHRQHALPTFPTAWADGAATALFVTDPNTLHQRLHARIDFECAIITSQRTASVSESFPGTLFTDDTH